MTVSGNLLEWLLGIILIAASLGVVLARKPVYSSLSFLLTLLTLASIYLQLSAEFISVMQVMVYAGAILVIFMFVMVLFQDAHEQISLSEAKSFRGLLIAAAAAFGLALVFLGTRFIGVVPGKENVPDGYGTVQSLGMTLYVNFFFPFEAVILLFLVAVVGSLYIAKRSRPAHFDTPEKVKKS